MNSHASATASTVLNGVDVGAAVATITAVKTNEELAAFQFRVRNQWVEGTQNRSSIQGFYGAGHEDVSRTSAFEYVSDEPHVLLGNNAGANPGEFLLHALAGCITTTLVLHATARGISLRKLSTEIEGNVDLRGALGLDESIPSEFLKIRVGLYVTADCADEELDDLIAYALDHSAVSNTIRRPVSLEVQHLRN
jgi:uncharacterized OsmC-like protein